MTRYIRELRVTIHDMYGNYKNTPWYDFEVYNPTDRALGIRLFGGNKRFGLGTWFNILPFIRKLENYGWEVLDIQSRYEFRGKLMNLDINLPYSYLEVRKIEEVDIEQTKHEGGDIKQKIVSCDLCNEPRLYTHISGLEVCQDHYHNMIGSDKKNCSCQEAGEDCCETHSTEPPMDSGMGIVPNCRCEDVGHDKCLRHNAKLVKKQAD